MQQYDIMDMREIHKTQYWWPHININLLSERLHYDKLKVCRLVMTRPFSGEVVVCGGSVSRWRPEGGKVAATDH